MYMSVICVGVARCVFCMCDVMLHVACWCVLWEELAWLSARCDVSVMCVMCDVCEVLVGDACV